MSTYESVDEILWCYHMNETISVELLYSKINLPLNISKI